MTAPAKVARERYHAVADQRERSPIPTPAGRWIMGQRWEDLLFCNWPVSPEALRPLIPRELEIDTAEGSAWVSVVPMWMEDAHFRRLPPLPFISTFPEVNLRTYVRAGEHAGVWFFSLDTESRVNVAIARYGFRLPYFFARVAMERRNGMDFRSFRPGGAATLDVRYAPHGEEFAPAEGTLEHFLTERYSMFCPGRGGSVYRGDIQHAPWGLRRAEFEMRKSDLATAAGIDLRGAQPNAFFSAATDVILWKPVRI